MSVDEFYADGFFDDDGSGVETIDDLSDAESDQLAEGIGYESFAAMEAQWAAAEAEQEAAAQQAELAAIRAHYGNERLGTVLQAELEKAGHPAVNFPDIEPTACRLLESREWLRRQDTLEGEPLAAAAIRDAIRSLVPAENETEGLERWLLRKGR
jgi:hypothetical protein